VNIKLKMIYRLMMPRPNATWENQQTRLKWAKKQLSKLIRLDKMMRNNGFVDEENICGDVSRKT
jgi:hypothetical protein